MACSIITAAQLREVLNYNPDAGVFTWRTSTGQRSKPGNVAGTLHHEGYIRIGVLGAYYAAHRLAWLYMTGEWPASVTDHIDGVRSNNRFQNLRSVNHKTNSENQRPHGRGSISGILGVYSAPGGRWIARIRSGKTLTNLGTYSTIPAASAAYIEAKRRLHVGCTI